MSRTKLDPIEKAIAGAWKRAQTIEGERNVAIVKLNARYDLRQSELRAPLSAPVLAGLDSAHPWRPELLGCPDEPENGNAEI